MAEQTETPSPSTLLDLIDSPSSPETSAPAPKRTRRCQSGSRVNDTTTTSSFVAPSSSSSSSSFTSAEAKARIPQYLLDHINPLIVKALARYFNMERKVTELKAQIERVVEKLRIEDLPKQCKLSTGIQFHKQVQEEYNIKVKQILREAEKSLVKVYLEGLQKAHVAMKSEFDSFCQFSFFRENYLSSIGDIPAEFLPFVQQYYVARLKEDIDRRCFLNATRKKQLEMREDAKMKEVEASIQAPDKTIRALVAKEVDKQVLKVSKSMKNDLHNLFRLKEEFFGSRKTKAKVKASTKGKAKGQEDDSTKCEREAKGKTAGKTLVRVRKRKTSHEAALFMISKFPIRALDALFTNRFFTNLSSIQLTFDERTLLTLGSKFAPTSTLDHPSLCSVVHNSFKEFARRTRLHYHFRNKHDHRTPLERKLYTPTGWEPPPEHRNCELELWLSNLHYEINNKLEQVSLSRKPKRNFNLKAFSSLKDKLNHNKVTVCSADKNLGTVLIPTSLYESLCCEFLHDTSKYLPLNPEATPLIVEEVGKAITQLVEDTQDWSDDFGLSKFAKCLLKHSNSRSVLPRFYGLVKIHKKRLAIRPIAGAHSWCTSGLARWVDQILRNLNDSIPWIIKDTDELVRRLDCTRFRTDAVLKTLDVQALYPSIPIDRCNLESFETFLLNNKFYKYKVDQVKVIMRALRIIFFNHVVVFRGKQYIQVSGVAMGIQCSPMFANIFWQCWK